jgi:hypothetical protein
MKPYLAGNASGDYDNLDPVKGLLEFVCTSGRSPIAFLGL